MTKSPTSEPKPLWGREALPPAAGDDQALRHNALDLEGAGEDSPS